MPELVVRDATGQVETVAYHQLPAMLLNELQKQQATIEEQKAELNSLKARLVQVESQQAEITALRHEVRMLLATRTGLNVAEAKGN